MILREPTSEECSKCAVLDQDDREVMIACWYPQMGGYVARAVVRFWKADTNTCFECYVWHDGDFPFSGPQSPGRLHHCNPEQFVEFGEHVKAAMGLFSSG